MYKLAIFSSGQGSTFEYIAGACQKSALKAHCQLLVTDRPQAPALQIAERYKTETLIAPPKQFDSLESWDRFVVTELQKQKIDFVVLAGFLKKVGPQIINSYKGKIINSHPSLLPAYGGKGMYGPKIHQAVIKNKEEKSGVTIHQVNCKYDEGKIIAQQEVLIQPNETPESLETKVKACEKELIVNTLSSLIDSLTS